jgi:hypothetical protein
MLIFNLTVHHIWGSVLAKFQGARAVAYTDDGYIKGKLSVEEGKKNRGTCENKYKIDIDS